MNQTGISQFNQARIEWAIRLRYSPMPDLNMERITRQLNEFRIGELRAVGKTWEIMMERDGELAINSEKRKADSATLDWQIATDGSPDGDKHAAALQYFYNNLTATKALDQDATGSVDELIFQVLSALDYYYSAHEILLRVDNPAAKEVTAEFRHTPVWFFEARRGYLGYLKHIFDLYGQPCIAGEWLTAVNTGWMRPLSVAYGAKWSVIPDWLTFCERYGSGFLEGITEAAKDSTEWNEAQEALEKLSNDASVLHHKNVQFKFLEHPNKNQLPFQPLAEIVDRLYAKCYRGVDLATGSRASAGSQASGGGAQNAVGASVQREESGILLVRDAKWVTGVFNDRIDRPIIRYLFNEEPRAWFSLMPPLNDTTMEDLQSLRTLVPMGLRVALKEVYQRFRWSVPAAGEMCLGSPQSTVPSPQSANGNAEGRSAFAQLRRDKMQNEEGQQTPGGQKSEDGGQNEESEETPDARQSSIVNRKSTPGEKTHPAQTSDDTPIAAGADPTRNPGLLPPGARTSVRFNGALVDAPTRQMPDTQVDASDFWSRGGLAPRGADGQTLPMPSLGYAVPNIANHKLPDTEALTDRLKDFKVRGLGHCRAAQGLQAEINRREEQAKNYSASLANDDFDSNEPRDKYGKWTNGGNSSASATNSPPHPTAHETSAGQTGDDDTDDIPLTYGGAHAKLRQSQSDASAQLYNKGGAELKGLAVAGRAAAEANPVVGFADGAYQAVEGKDAIDSNKHLTPGQRLKSTGDALLAIAPFVLKGGRLIRMVGETEEAVNVGRGLAKGWSALVKSENFALAENQVVSGLIKDGKVFAIGDPALGHADLAKKFGIELVDGKLPKGMEGFLAQKIGGKVMVAGAGINGPGAHLVISETGKNIAQGFFK